MNQIEIKAHAAPWRAAVSEKLIAAPLVMVEREECMQVEPSVRLSIEASQRLMDDLWYCGLRPTEGTGSAGSLKATERHLEDMRKLVFAERRETP